MPRGQRSKEPLKSEAYLSSINVFFPMQVAWELSEKQATAIFSPYEYFDTWSVGKWTENGFETSRKEGLIRKFPIIYQGDGSPWDLGNKYLMFLYNVKAAEKTSPSIKSIQSVASHLLQYRRWIEDQQAQNIDLHELHFPDKMWARVTYRYRRYLETVRGSSIMAPSTASIRASTIVNFYRGLQQGNLVDKLDNAAFVEKKVSVTYVDSAGLVQQMPVITTDLHLSSMTSNVDDGTYIEDEGKLHPLTESEQETLWNALYRFDHYHFTLMVQFALFTGARISTVATLRIKELRELEEKAQKNPRGEVVLKVGSGTRIELKNARRLRKSQNLAIPASLVIDLLNYVDSPDATFRRQQPDSYFGNTDDNYVFLTEKGTPYITSEQEKRERANSNYSQRISLDDRVDFPIAVGNGIRNWIYEINDICKALDPEFREFRFHDLRATFGLNYVSDSIAQGHSRNEIVKGLMDRMGHRNEATSLLYIDYKGNQEKIRKSSEVVTDRLDRVRTIIANQSAEDASYE